MQKDFLAVNHGSGITYGKGTEVTYCAVQYYAFPNGGVVIGRKLVENNSDWFKEKVEDKNRVGIVRSYQTDEGITIEASVIGDITLTNIQNIKSAIEGVLNEKESKMPETKIGTWDDWFKLGEKHKEKYGSVDLNFPKPFTTDQYKEIWDMIFQVTGYPKTHPKYIPKNP